MVDIGLRCVSVSKVEFRLEFRSSTFRFILMENDPNYITRSVERRSSESGEEPM